MFDDFEEISRTTSHLPRGRCGLKYHRLLRQPTSRGSPSARKVWIEIWRTKLVQSKSKRHLPRGRCGLKCRISIKQKSNFLVTFREEGVDWNLSWLRSIVNKLDRHLPRGRCGLKSLLGVGAKTLDEVTFREEGVDWNMTNKIGTKQIQASPSARKVWIEMPNKHQTKIEFFSHLPRGRCGLKYWLFDMFAPLSCHLPRGRCGLKSA